MLQPQPTPVYQDPEMQAAAVHHSRLANILDAVGSLLGGSQTVHVTKHPDGTMEVSHDPSTGKEKWGRIAAAALSGAAKGWAVGQGPGGAGRAAGAGFESGFQMPEQALNNANQEVSTNAQQLLQHANWAATNQQTVINNEHLKQSRVKFASDWTAAQAAAHNAAAQAPGSQDLGNFEGVTDLPSFTAKFPDAMKGHMNSDIQMEPVFNDKGEQTGLHVTLLGPGADSIMPDPPPIPTAYFDPATKSIQMKPLDVVKNHYTYRQYSQAVQAAGNAATGLYLQQEGIDVNRQNAQTKATEAGNTATHQDLENKKLRLEIEGKQRDARTDAAFANLTGAVANAPAGTTDTSIPTPAAPARPGGVTTGTFQGQPVTIDAQGNATNSTTGAPVGNIHDANPTPPAAGGAPAAAAPSTDPVVWRRDGGADIPPQSAEMLKRLPPDIASTVAAIGSYDLNLNTIPRQQRQAYIDAATQVFPGFDEKEYASRQKLLTDIKSGSLAQGRRSLNMAVSHIGELYDAMQELAPSNFRLLNQGIQAFAGQVGGPTAASLAKYRTAATGVSSELATNFKGSGAGTQVETDKWEKNLDPRAPGEAQDAGLNTAVDMLGNRLAAMQATIQDGMGSTTPYPVLTPDAINTLQRIPAGRALLQKFNLTGVRPTAPTPTQQGAATQPGQTATRPAAAPTNTSLPASIANDPTWASDGRGGYRHFNGSAWITATPPRQ
jgi:hypothetical protein